MNQEKEELRPARHPDRFHLGAYDQVKEMTERVGVDFYNDPDDGYTRVNFLL